MKTAIKSKGKIVSAYQLGAGSAMEDRLIKKGRIRRHNNADYELFSLESKNGRGQFARKGDYFKVSVSDGVEYPYPNERNWFEENHVHLIDDLYAQHTEPIAIWENTDIMCDEMRYLLNNRIITICEQDSEHYYNATLKGVHLSAPKDSLILFYKIYKDEKGNIQDIVFNFIARKEFMDSYSYYEENV